MKKLLEIVVCFIHPLAVVLAWINLAAGATSPEGGSSSGESFCWCQSCRSCTS